MADFAPLGVAEKAFLAHAVRREVVMQHEVVLGSAFKGFHQLGVAQRAQSGNDDGLRLAALEQRGAMRFRQYAYLDFNRAHGARVAAIDARLAV